MLGARAVSRRWLSVTVLLTLPLSACVIHGDGNESRTLATQTPTPTVVSSTSAADGPGALYPVPDLGDSTQQRTYVKFETGRAGSPLLTAPDESVVCRNNPASGSRSYQAVTSDFSQFDAGSIRPGEDFSVELYIAGAPGASATRNQSSIQPSNAVWLSYVTGDGVHHTLHTQDRLTVHLDYDNGSGSVSFAATMPTAGPEREISITGVISCRTTDEFP
ncbi:hypothetical protein SAMN05421642_1301 [Rhodococcoides kyotonense]|uniref:Lipoprotein n=1 Tax=Rhodococcoides kyotonense TaxID=398843 RepID=A0A239N512_9NOCA|nr:hypothetical protein SAMN05421642_1301 [Rhodococcus kyotonensis]